MRALTQYTVYSILLLNNYPQHLRFRKELSCLSIDLDQHAFVWCAKQTGSTLNSTPRVADASRYPRGGRRAANIEVKL